jgi:hypothetical protein
LDAVGFRGNFSEIDAHERVADVLEHQIGARLVGRHDRLRSEGGSGNGGFGAVIQHVAGGWFGFYVWVAHEVS